MEMEFQIRAIRESFESNPDGIKLFAKQTKGKQRYYAQELKFKQTNVNERVQPFLVIDKHEAQKLIDDLWDCGLRPSEGSGSAGAMLATQEHLRDMKDIAFHTLKMQKKEQRND